MEKVKSLKFENLTIEYLESYDERSRKTEKTLIRAVSESDEKIWAYDPPPDAELGRAVLVCDIAATPDGQHLFIWQSNCRRLKLNPKTGEILESIYQMT